MGYYGYGIVQAKAAYEWLEANPCDTSAPIKVPVGGCDELTATPSPTPGPFTPPSFSPVTPPTVTPPTGATPYPTHVPPTPHPTGKAPTPYPTKAPASLPAPTPHPTG